MIPSLQLFFCLIAYSLTLQIPAMGKIIHKFCRDLHRDGNYTFPVPEHVPTGDCDYIWKTENKTVIDYGLKNLSLPSCLDGVHFVVRCDGGDKLREHTFIFRVNDTKSDTELEGDPSEHNLLWLVIPLVLLCLTIMCILLIMFRRKLLCCQRTAKANRPNPDGESTDRKNGDGIINGEPHQLTNPVPNHDGVKNHMNNGENFPMLTIRTESDGGRHSLNNNHSPV